MSNKIVKDNVLINASYSLSLVEQRLLFLAIIEVRKGGLKVKIDHSKPIKIHAESYIKQFNVGRNAAYEALQAACKNLFERKFSYQENRDKQLARVTSRWVSQIAYLDDTATVELFFSPSIIPLITELEKRFTSYDVEQIANLTSAYAVRLYELLICWRSVGKTPVIPLEELRLKLGVLEDEYQRMHHFKARVLVLSLEQINKYTDITAMYSQQKSGRTITGFTFEFKIKDDKKKPIIEDKSVFSIDGLSDAQLNRIVKNEMFVSDYNHLIGARSVANNSIADWAHEMIKRLKLDSKQFNKRPIRDYLK